MPYAPMQGRGGNGFLFLLIVAAIVAIVFYKRDELEKLLQGTGNSTPPPPPPHTEEENEHIPQKCDDWTADSMFALKTRADELVSRLAAISGNDEPSMQQPEKLITATSDILAMSLTEFWDNKSNSNAFMTTNDESHQLLQHAAESCTINDVNSVYNFELKRPLVEKALRLYRQLKEKETISAEDTEARDAIVSGIEMTPYRPPPFLIEIKNFLASLKVEEVDADRKVGITVGADKKRGVASSPTYVVY